MAGKKKEVKMLEPVKGIQPRNTPVDDAAVQKYVDKYGERPDPQTSDKWEYVEVNREKKTNDVGQTPGTEWQIRPAKPKKPKAK